MKYPKFLNKNDVIGVTAPSDGVSDYIKQNRLDSAILKWQEYGYKIIETEHVRCSVDGKSCDSKTQAKELEELFLNDKVSVVFCVSGGDFLLEMLTYLDYSIIERNPKWIQGYSDPTGLLFTITTKLDIATIYGDNFKTFGMDPWHESLVNNHRILTGDLVKQNNFLMYEKEGIKYETGLELYNLDTPVEWKSLNRDNEVTIKGRIIGGCIDVLVSLVGTKFDYAKEFIERYKEDGIVWYFDNAELTSEQLIRALWQLKMAGWFKHSKGIIFGRSMTESSYYEISFENALNKSLNDLEIPVLWNLDLGHISPRMTIINGSLVEINYKDGKGSIEFSLK